MWYLKFRVRHHGCIFTPLTKELGVVDYAYPLARRKTDVALAKLTGKQRAVVQVWSTGDVWT